MVSCLRTHQRKIYTEQLTVKSSIQWYNMTSIWRHLVLAVITGQHLFISVPAFAYYLESFVQYVFVFVQSNCQLFIETQETLFRTLVVWLVGSQDIFEGLFADIIFQYSFDSSVSVWYLVLLKVFLWFTYLSLNAVSLTP